VSVKNVEGLHQQKLPKLYNPVRVCGVVRRQRKHAQAFLMCALLQQAVFPANDELPVAAVLKADGKQ
jgi:hypothetical protein